MPTPRTTKTTEPALDTERCRLARLSRDSRFDGEFFLAVKTTGIYCRPVCPARAPAEKNVRYFRHAAQAAESGYRPCLRCRPESAPNSPAWRGSSTTVQRALDLIAAGALNEDSIHHLADRLGVGERYLRKLFQREVGVSPLAVAQNHRLLFAKKLLAETELPMTTVAFAAGFSSIRRFNSAIRNSFNTTPKALRTRREKPAQGSHITLQLQYRPPYDWAGVINFFQRHAVEGVEQVNENEYQRNFRAGDETGQLRVRPIPGRNALRLQLNLPNPGQLMPLVATVRRMFDLDANPQVINEVLGLDPVLQSLTAKFPGIRAPAHGSVAESVIRSIVGQQVSIQAARKVCSRMALAAHGTGGTNEQPICFPLPGELAGLGDEHFPMPGRRRETLREVCQRAGNDQGQLDLATLEKIKGIGPWTVGLVAMRGYGDPDIFPTGDLGLVKAYAALSGGELPTENQINRWRPWRSYAANLLWRSLSL